MAAARRFRGGLKALVVGEGKERSGGKESENYCREHGLSWGKLV